MRSIHSALLAVLLLACAACDPKERIYPVSGKVTYKGSPAAGAAVYFHPRGRDAEMIIGVVQADGSFALTCGARGTGAPAGDYDVTIEWKRHAGPRNVRPQTGADWLRGRYADPKRPRLHARVEEHATILPPFDLDDAR